MGIATLLLGLLLMGVHGFNSTTNRRAAVGTLMGVFDQARTVAISDGRATYVVFVSSPHGSTQDTSTVVPRMWGQAYALFEDPVLQDASTATSFLPQQRSAWLYLPTSVAFKCDSSNDATLDSLTTTPTTTSDPPFNVPATAGGATALRLPYLKFDPAGQIVDAAGQVISPGAPQLRVLLFEGTADGSGNEIITRHTAGTTGANVKYSLDEILLKPSTGRASYTTDPVYNLAVSN